MDACHYHSNASASWFCGGCEKFLCVDCFPGGESNFGPRGSRCPVCSSRLTWLGSANEAPPFWRVTSRFFAYAVQPPALVITGIYAFVTVWVGGGFFGLAMQLLLLALLVRYSMTVIARVGTGDMKAPSILDVMGGSGTSSATQLFLLMALSGYVFVRLAQVVPALALAFGAFQAAALPAMIMVLAVTENLFAAMNPVLIVRVITRIGWSYLLMCLAITTIAGGPYYIESMLPEGSSIVVPFILAAAAFYFTVVMAATQGYVLFHRASELGIATDDVAGVDLPQDEFIRRQALGFANIYAQERRNDDARLVLREAIEKFPADLALRERLQVLLLRDEYQQGLAQYSNRYLWMLWQAGSVAKAVTAWLDIRKVISDFRPENPGVCEAMAALLEKQGRGRDAMVLLVNLHQRAPDYPELPRAYLMLARLYLDTKNDTVNAGRLLQFLEKKFPQENVLAEVARLRGLMARLASAALPSPKAVSPQPSPSTTPPRA